MTRFSICIPAYNRANHLPALLDSIFAQDYGNYEVVICEDMSPQREQIAAVVHEYAQKHPEVIRYIENQKNLGYDANIRELIAQSSGDFCFFMGNDDIMCPGALREVAGVIESHDDVGFVLKSYAWFEGDPSRINQEIRYFSESRFMRKGREAITICYRRAGVISGFIVLRKAAQECATSEFDGALYYQMHVVASVLAQHNAVSMPKVLVLCRGDEPPDFGNSENEKGKYTPGKYTPEARLSMIGGVVAIARRLDEKNGTNYAEAIIHDYANYFYPYIRDQLTLPLKSYWNMYRKFGEMGFSKYPLFHVYFLVCYVLGEKRFDDLTRFVRKWMGRSPKFGI